MSVSISKKMARGATWMLFFKLFDRGLGFISTIVLARLLVPADFGLVAMAMSVIALIELASAFSFEVALIQRKDPTRAHYDTTWTLRLLLAWVCGVLTAAMAWPTAHFYEDLRLAPIMFFLAAGWVIEGLENVGTVNFRRELDFRREFMFLAARRVTGVVVTLTIAVLWRSYWALIAGTLAGRTMGVILSYLMQSYRPRFSVAVWRELMAFSGWLFATNALVFINMRLSHFVIGRVQGAGPLGLYTVANDVAALASQEITMPINRAVMPGLSRMAEQEGGMRNGLLQVVGAVALIALPASFGLAAVAQPLVLTLLGPQWLGAVPAVQVLAFAGALHSLTASNHSAYLASGKSHVPAYTNGVLAVTLIPLLILLHTQGVVGIAWAQLGATAASVSVSVALMKRFLDVSPMALARTVARPLMAASMMGVAVYQLEAVQFGWSEPMHVVLRLILGVLSGVLIYSLSVAFLWWIAGRPLGVESLIWTRMRQAFVGQGREKLS